MALNLGTLLAHLKLDGSNFGKGISAAEQATEKLATAAAVVGAAAAAGFGAAVVEGVRFASTLEQARIGFTTMLDSAEKADKFITDMKAFAAKTPFEFEGLLQNARMLKAMGFEADHVMPVMTAIGDAVSAMGGSGDMVEYVTRALGQMMAKGKLASGEMRQLTEQGIPAWEMLADAIGVTVPEAMKKVEDGAVSSATFLNAFMQGTHERFGGAMEKMSQTMMGLWSTLKDTVVMRLGDIAAPLVDALKRSLPAITTFAGDVLDTIGPPLATALGKTAEIMGLVFTVFNSLSPAAKTLIGAVAGVTAGVLALGAAGVMLIPVISGLITMVGALNAIALPELIVGTLVAAAVFAQFAIAGAAIASLFAVLAAWAGVLYHAWSENFMGIQAFVLSLWYTMEGWAKAIVPLLTSAFEIVKDNIDKVLTSIRDGFVDTMLDIVNAIQRMIIGVAPILEKLGLGDLVSKGISVTVRAQTALAGIKDESVGTDVGQLVTALSTGAEEFVGGMVNDITGAATYAFDGLVALLQNVLPPEMLQAVKDFLNGTTGASGEMDDYSNALKGLKNATGATSGETVKAGETMAAVAKTLGLFDRGELHGVMSQLRSIAGLDIHRLQEAEEAMGMSAEDLIFNFEQLVESGEMTQENLDIFRDKIELATDAVDDFEGSTTKFQEIMYDVGNNVMDAMGTMGTLIQDAVSGAEDGGAWGAIIAVIMDLLFSAESFARKIEILDEAFQSLSDALGALWENNNTTTVALGQLISVIGEILTPILEHLGDTMGYFGPVLSMVAQLFSGLAPLFEIVGSIMDTTLPLLKYSFMALMGILFIVGEIILGVVWLIQQAWNWILGAIISVLESIGFESDSDVIKDLEDSMSDVSATEDAMQELALITWDTSYAELDAAAAAEESADATEEATAAMEEFTESLTNVPDGFKVAAARYAAQDAEATSVMVSSLQSWLDYLGSGGFAAFVASQTQFFASGGIVRKATLGMVGEAGPEAIIPLDQLPGLIAAGSAMAGGGSSGGDGQVMIFIENIEVKADDPQQFLDKLQKELGRRNFARTGLPIMTGAKFSITGPG